MLTWKQATMQGSFKLNTCTMCMSLHLFHNLQSQFNFFLSFIADGFTTKVYLFECLPMSAWRQMWCQLDNDEIASDLSGLAFIVVIGVIYCSDVLKLCHALLRTLPFTLIELATNSDRSHCWQTQSETLETASTSSSHLDPVYFQALSFSFEQITCT